MFRINFELQQLDKIVPWGEEHPILHWFGLTDGLLWINAGEGTIYEYSHAAVEYWGLKETPYNDYQLSRFLEDFSEIFRYVVESIPFQLYEHIEDFIILAHKWNEQHWDLEDEIFDAFYDNEYLTLITWYLDRVIDSGHLVGGPHIGFFRCENKIKIVWNSDYTLENGESIWKTPTGIYEIDYHDFVKEVERFYHDFYNKMNQQVENAVLKDWKNVEIDKKRLKEENVQRQEIFNQAINMLKQENGNKTDWENMMLIYDKMISEVGSE